MHAEAGVMTVTLNRLARKNSITSDMYAALGDAIARAQEDAAVRVVVLQGHETVFSAGNDIGDFLDKPPAGQDSPVFRFLRGIAGFRKPLVAAVCDPEEIWQMTDELLVAQAAWLPQYAEEVPRAAERLATHERNGTRVKLRQTPGAARVAVKTVEQMARTAAEARANAATADKAKMTR